MSICFFKKIDKGKLADLKREFPNSKNNKNEIELQHTISTSFFAWVLKSKPQNLYYNLLNCVFCPVFLKAPVKLGTSLLDGGEILVHIKGVKF